MKKIFILTIFIVFFTSCSNLEEKKEISLKDRENLIFLVESIKTNLKKGETKLLEESLAPSIRNGFVKDEIQNIDFSRVNILNSKPQFLGSTATNIVGFTVQSTTVYYDVEYKLKNGEWKIVKFEERRR